MISSNDHNKNQEIFFQDWQMDSPENLPYANLPSPYDNNPYPTDHDMTQKLYLQQPEQYFEQQQMSKLQANLDASRSLDMNEATKQNNLKFQCHLCEKSYSRTFRLKLHQNRDHFNTPKRYACPHQGCNLTFSEKGNLYIHKRKHTGYNPYQCKTCQKKFSTIGNLQDHERRHANERPHKCQHCQKQYYRKYQLIAHLERHEKELKEIESFNMANLIRYNICGGNNESAINLEKKQDHHDQIIQTQLDHQITHNNQSYHHLRIQSKICHQQQSLVAQGEVRHQNIFKQQQSIKSLKLPEPSNQSHNQSQEQSPSRYILKSHETPQNTQVKVNKEEQNLLRANIASSQMTGQYLSKDNLQKFQYSSNQFGSRNQPSQDADHEVISLSSFLLDFNQDESYKQQ